MYSSDSRDLLQVTSLARTSLQKVHTLNCNVSQQKQLSFAKTEAIATKGLQNYLHSFAAKVQMYAKERSLQKTHKLIA